MAPRKPVSPPTGQRPIAARPARLAVTGEGVLKPTRVRAKRRVAKAKPLPPAQIAEIFARFYAIDPQPKGELDFINPFTLLVAVVLSAQATDVSVNKATKALFALADTPEAMAGLGAEQIEELIKTIGLFRTKARHVVALSHRLIAEHAGEVPRQREVLETLPGVGRKTANVVLNTAFGEPTIAVDTHLFRVANRIPLAPGKTPLAVELGLMEAIPPPFKRNAHHWLILHGRYVCKARRPECWRCPIADLCRFEPKTPPPG
jgi:endonuclease-3